MAMLFAAAAVAGALVADESLRSGAPRARPQDYAMRMAAVFTMSTATIALRTRVASRWIGLLGLVVAVVLLVSVGLTPWVELLFPGWVLLLSVDILWHELTAGSGTTDTDASSGRGATPHR